MDKKIADLQAKLKASTEENQEARDKAAKEISKVES
jgi:hypothetical protein